jgi:NTE family protein
VISPSQRLDGVAAHYVGALPRPVRALLEVLGANRSGGAGLASYLLFEAPYTRALIDLGYGDTMARREEVMDFLTERRDPGPKPSSRVVVL